MESKTMKYLSIVAMMGLIFMLRLANIEGKYKRELNDLKKENHIKDSLWKHCNGDISRFKNDFMWQNYVENHTDNQ